MKGDRSIFIGLKDETPPGIKAKEVNVKDGTGEILVTATEPLSTAQFYFRKAGETLFQSLPAEFLAPDQIRLPLKDLKPNTTYEYQVLLQDLKGNLFLSETFSFKTLLDTTPPTVIENKITSLTTTTASIHLVTDEPLLKAILHLTNTSTGTIQTFTYDNPSQDLTAQLSSLKSSTSYSYTWELWDLAGNVGLTPPQTFTTQASGDPFFLENYVVSTFVSPWTPFSYVTLHLKLAKDPDWGIFSYRKVGESRWKFEIIASPPQEGNVTVTVLFPPLSPRTQYEYKLTMHYSVTWTDPFTGKTQKLPRISTSQTQTFQT